MLLAKRKQVKRRLLFPRKAWFDRLTTNGIFDISLFDTPGLIYPPEQVVRGLLSYN
jgi:hypothetical protein